jgi:predicted negative regulator of RcsB-dependent stress response
MSKHAAELTRKDMKAPDAFQTAAGKAAAWISGKQKAIVAAVVGALVLVAVVLGALSWMDSRKEAAGALLYRTLDDADGQISSVPLPGVMVPLFPSVEAQYRAVLGRADELRKTYPSSDAARTAALAAAAANLRLAAWDAAIADYESYLAKATPKDSLSFLAIEGIARAKEAKGDLPGALAALDRLQTPSRADRAALERARLLARSGKPDDARKILAAFQQDFKDSQLRPEADKQLAALGGTR